MSSTAYCLTGTMANGAPARSGAVASNLWPLGTHIYVPELGHHFIVEDRSGSSTQLDIAMPGDCSGAIAYGRRNVTVIVEN